MATLTQPTQRRGKSVVAASTTGYGPLFDEEEHSRTSTSARVDVDGDDGDDDGQETDLQAHPALKNERERELYGLPSGSSKVGKLLTTYTPCTHANYLHRCKDYYKMKEIPQIYRPMLNCSFTLLLDC
jgi:hypothetical protein